MRGFDIFMKAAKLICDRMPNVIFFVVGTDRVAYGGDESYTGGKTFKQWVLDQDAYDLSRIKFIGRLPMDELGRTLASSDLHVYLTVPFVLSWSMMDAMSCGAVVLASDTSPVKEMIRDGENGLLANFFSPEDFADKACAVLADPDAYRHLGRAAEKMVEEQYSLNALLPQMLKLYEDAMQTKTGLEPPHEHKQAAPKPKPVAAKSSGPFGKKTGSLLAADIVTGKAPPKGWSPFRG
jgi:glycosyltransferase involved in cell wall biosynthesis